MKQRSTHRRTHSDAFLESQHLEVQGYRNGAGKMAPLSGTLTAFPEDLSLSSSTCMAGLACLCQQFRTFVALFWPLRTSQYAWHTHTHLCVRAHACIRKQWLLDQNTKSTTPQPLRKGQLHSSKSKFPVREKDIITPLTLIHQVAVHLCAGWRIFFLLFILRQGHTAVHTGLQLPRARIPGVHHHSLLSQLLEYLNTYRGAVAG